MIRSFISIFFFATFSHQLYAKTTADTVIHGVAVHFGYTPNIFPQSWLTKEINARGVALAPTERRRCISIITKVLKKYPETLLFRSLKAVYFLKSMDMYDVGFGGTNSRFAVYISDDGTKEGYTDDYIEQTFHHEFSSILFRNFPSNIDTAAWKAAIIPGFDYNDPYGGVGAIRNNESSQQFDSTLSSEGFLTQYSLSDIENDINTIAQNLFCPHPNFWGFVKYYPRVKQKVSLLINFYHKLDPVFTEPFFRGFGKN